MALIEAGKRVGRFLHDMTVRARYSRDTIRLLQPFLQDEDVGRDWGATFEFHLLEGKREHFVSAAIALLPPRPRAKLLVQVVETLGEDDFRPRRPSGNRNIINDIWWRSSDKPLLRREVELLPDIAPESRNRVLHSFVDTV